MPEKTKLEDYANMNNTRFAFIDLNEKTKLEDYANMNNTGFAFIDLNEELEDEDLNGEDYEINENLYNKFNEIYESGKALFLRIKSKYLGQNIYYELLNFKNTIIYKTGDGLYLHIYYGNDFSTIDKKITYDDNGYYIVSINIYKDSSNKFYLSMYNEG